MSSQDRFDFLSTFQSKFAGMKKLQVAAMIGLFVPPLAVIALAASNMITLQFARVAAGIWIAVGSVAGLIASNRRPANYRDLGSLICELNGPEIIIPMIGWISDQRGPFPSYPDPNYRKSALVCIARNIGYLSGRESELTVPQQTFLTNLAVELSSGRADEPWKWDLVQGAVTASRNFRSSSAADRIEKALARGDFHPPK